MHGTTTKKKTDTWTFIF